MARLDPTTGQIIGEASLADPSFRMDRMTEVMENILKGMGGLSSRITNLETEVDRLIRRLDQMSEPDGLRK